MSPDFTPFLETLEKIATRMVAAANVRPGQKLLITYDEPRQPLVDLLIEAAAHLGAKPFTLSRDLDQQITDIKTLDPEEIPDYFVERKRTLEQAENLILLYGPTSPEVESSLDPERHQVYCTALAEIARWRYECSLPWLQFYQPTEYFARQEGMSFAEYCRMLFDACDLPWSEVALAQDLLIAELDVAKQLTLRANSGDANPDRRSEVTMSIDGFTFANSTVLRNFPGSEVFSAPVRDSVEGQLYASGWYEELGGRMRDLTLKISAGKIIPAQAAEGDAHLQQVLSNGEGARYFGEVALGTNCKLRRRYFNPLLCEKAAGSFHLALGHCYSYSEYGGKPVRLNNGNTQDLTPLHWDLTFMMLPEFGGGEVLLDGRTISKDGRFLDPRLSLLNTA